MLGPRDLHVADRVTCICYPNLAKPKPKKVYPSALLIATYCHRARKGVWRHDPANRTHAAHIAGVVSCYDHLVIMGTLGHAVDQGL
jgi:hypothetical protein